MAKDSITQQKLEFDAMRELASSFRSLCNTPVVDDDYPRVRHYYESHLAAFIKAMQENDRFEQGNRYGLAPVR